MSKELQEIGISLDQKNTLVFDAEKFATSLRSKQEGTKAYEHAIRVTVMEINAKGYKNITEVYNSGVIEDIIIRKLEIAKKNLITTSPLLRPLPVEKKEGDLATRGDVVKTAAPGGTENGWLLSNTIRSIRQNRKQLSEI